jgi:hypothetical protein
MKKILLTVVLGVAVSAVGQSTAAPAQGQPATPPAQGQAAAAPAAPASQAPVIKDPAEYNAYVSAVDPAKDANAKISGLEAFVTQYPNSVMKNQALELLMGTYQQAGNKKKAMETAGKVLAVEPCQEQALFLLAYFDRQDSEGGDPNGKQLAADGEKYATQGLDCLAKFTKPEGTSEADFAKMKEQMKETFLAAEGWGALQEKDNKKAADSLRAVLDANPDAQKDLGLVYPLALAYLGQTPPDYQNGIWFAARAAAIAPAANQPGLEKYARSQYIKFHAGDDGWADVLGAAKAGATQVPIKPAPTPAEQCHAMVAPKHPEDPTNAEDLKKLVTMSFAEWQFALTNCTQQDQDMVWNVIKGKAVQMNGTIISTTSTEFMIAGSSDDIEAKKADITLKFEDKVPVRLIPKDGASFDFQGEPASYTPSPFMMVMEKGQLLKAKAAPTPAKKPAVVHKKPAAAAQ